MLCAASVSNQRRICSHSAGAFVLNRLSPCLIIWITRIKVNACNLRISNEPCTDKAAVRRVELARKRRSAALDVYGECRDSEQKAKRLRACRQGELRPDRNHNSSKNCDLRVSNEPCTDKATVRRVELARKRRSVLQPRQGELRQM